MKPNSNSFGFSLRAGSTSLLMLCLCSAPMAFSTRALAQAAAPATNRFVGTITAVGAGLLTVKTDAGVEHKVTAPDGIKI